MKNRPTWQKSSLCWGIWHRLVGTCRPGSGRTGEAVLTSSPSLLINTSVSQGVWIYPQRGIASHLFRQQVFHSFLLKKKKKKITSSGTLMWNNGIEFPVNTLNKSALICHFSHYFHCQSAKWLKCKYVTFWRGSISVDFSHVGACFCSRLQKATKTSQLHSQPH